MNEDGEELGKPVVHKNYKLGRKNRCGSRKTNSSDLSDNGTSI